MVSPASTLWHLLDHDEDHVAAHPLSPIPQQNPDALPATQSTTLNISLPTPATHTSEVTIPRAPAHQVPPTSSLYRLLNHDGGILTELPSTPSDSNIDDSMPLPSAIQLDDPQDARDAVAQTVSVVSSSTYRSAESEEETGVLPLSAAVSATHEPWEVKVAPALYVESGSGSPAADIAFTHIVVIQSASTPADSERDVHLEYDDFTEKQCLWVMAQEATVPGPNGQDVQQRVLTEDQIYDIVYFLRDGDLPEDEELTGVVPYRGVIFWEDGMQLEAVACALCYLLSLERDWPDGVPEKWREAPIDRDVLRAVVNKVNQRFLYY